MLVLQRLWKRKLRRRATAEMHSHLAAARIQAAWKMSKGRRAFLAVKGAARRIQLWWRRQLPRQLLRRLRAEAQSTSALVELVASLRADLKEAKQKVQASSSTAQSPRTRQRKLKPKRQTKKGVLPCACLQEEALRSDHLQATTEELQRQLAKLKSENQTLLKKLEVAEGRGRFFSGNSRRRELCFTSFLLVPLCWSLLLLLSARGEARITTPARQVGASLADANSCCCSLRFFESQQRRLHLQRKGASADA